MSKQPPEKTPFISRSNSKSNKRSGIGVTGGTEYTPENSVPRISPYFDLYNNNGQSTNNNNPLNLFDVMPNAPQQQERGRGNDYGRGQNIHHHRPQRGDTRGHGGGNEHGNGRGGRHYVNYNNYGGGRGERQYINNQHHPNGRPQQQHGNLSRQHQRYRYYSTSNFHINFDNSDLIIINQLLNSLFDGNKSANNELYHKYAVKVRDYPSKIWWYCDKKWKKVSSRFPSITTTYGNNDGSNITTKQTGNVWISKGGQHLIQEEKMSIPTSPGLSFANPDVQEPCQQAAATTKPSSVPGLTDSPSNQQGISSTRNETSIQDNSSNINDDRPNTGNIDTAREDGEPGNEDSEPLGINNNIMVKFSSELDGNYWSRPSMNRRSRSNHTKAQTNPHEEINNDNDDIDGDVKNVNDYSVDDVDVEVVNSTDDDSSNDDSSNDDSNNDDSSNVYYTNFYNNLIDDTDNDSDNDSDDSEIDQDEFNEWDSIHYPKPQFNLCNYAGQHYKTFIVGKKVPLTKLERAVYRLNLLSNKFPCRRDRSEETKKKFLKYIKRVQQLATAQNMNIKKNWSVTFEDFFILPSNGHYIPQVKGACRGEFVDTKIIVTEITDTVVIYIFRVWLKEYCEARNLPYRPRPNLLYTDITKLAQMRANLPHLEPNTRAGFLDEMEFIQMRIENGTVHILIDGTLVKTGKKNNVAISKLIMPHKFSKDGKLEKNEGDGERRIRTIFAFNCFSQDYLATPEDVAEGRIPKYWYPPYEKDHGNGNNGDNTMRNIGLKEAGDNKTAYHKGKKKKG